MTGLWALRYAIDRIIDKAMERTLRCVSQYVSLGAFGITSTNGVAMQFNYLSDGGAIKFNEDGNVQCG